MTAMTNETARLDRAEKVISGMRVALEEMLAEYALRGGYEYQLLPRHEQPREIVAAIDAVNEAEAFLGENTVTEKLGRFDHHPDPAIDFCVEVETLENEWFNTKIGFMNGTPSSDELRSRVDKAMGFRVGGDLNAIAAKSLLRQIDGEMGARGHANV